MKRRHQQTYAQMRRSQIYRDWLGTDLPPNPDRNISQAGSNIDDILGGLAFSEGMTEAELKNSWASVVGDFIAGNTEPVSLKRGFLRLRVLQPAMRHHLEQTKRPLLEKLQRELGESVVKRLEFVFG